MGTLTSEALLQVAGDFAIALFIGALIGVDREQRKDAGIGGIRTFTLFALAGAISAWLAVQAGSAWIFAASTAGACALVVAGHVADAPRARGLTTEIAALVTFLLGGTTLYGHREVAVALGIATSALLAFKQPIHGMVQKIGPDDLRAGLKLLFATFIVLPLLPNRALDPWGALNPTRLWWLVILISGLSLVGYVAMRAFGAQFGTVLTGLLGGLVSSTAVTLSFARRSREDRGQPGLADALAAGVLGAWTIMFARVAVEVAVVHAPLLRPLWPILAGLGVLAMLTALIFFRRSRAAATGSTAGADVVPLTNPFSLVVAARFAAFFALVLLAVRVVQLESRAAGGVYAVAALAGTTDVDAVTLSMAESVRSGAETATVGAAAIVIAALTNTVVKCGLIVALGRGPLRKRVGIATVAQLVAASVLLAASR